MGLDTVELLVDIETKFGISIPDNEASSILTVGDFHNVVWKHIKKHEPAKSISQAIFYRLRKYCVEKFDLPAATITTTVDIENIFPRHKRRAVYKNMSLETGLTLPELVLPNNWQTFMHVIIAVAVLLNLAVAFTLVTFFQFSGWYFLLPLFGVLLCIGVSKILDVKRAVIKPGDMGGFINCIVSLNYTNLSKEYSVSRNEAEVLMNTIIADKSGVDIHEVTPDKKICEDLGMD